MKSSEVMATIAYLEKNFPVQDWSVNGIKIWPLLRIYASSDWINRSQFQNSLFTQAPKSSLENLKEVLLTARNLWRASANDKEKAQKIALAEILFLSDGVSFSKVNGKWMEKFCDPIRSVFSEHGISSLMLCPYNKAFVPRQSPSAFIQPALDLKRIEGKFRKKLKFFGKVNARDLHALDLYLETLNLPGRVSMSEWIAQLIPLFLSYRNYFSSLIEKVQPKLVFLVSYYSVEGMALISVCRSKGIPTVDIQHGVQGALHRSYGQWESVLESLELLPNVFWCWRQADVESIQKWAQLSNGKHFAIAGGHPFLFLDQFVKQRVFCSDYEKWVKERSPDALRILFTLSGLETDDKLREILEFLSALDSRNFFWLRCHPINIEQRKKLKVILQECQFKWVNVEDATTEVLPVILRHSDIHITNESSTVIEAEALGIPSVILSDYGAELFQTQLQRGRAFRIKSKEDLKNLFISKPWKSWPVSAVQSGLNLESSVSDLLRRLKLDLRSFHG